MSKTIGILGGIKKYMKKKSHKLLRIYYRVRYGIEVDWDHTVLFNLGNGRFVDVIQKGKYIDIVSHVNYPDTPKGTIRLIPYQPNHGVMVEWLDENGRMHWRVHCDYRKFFNMGMNFGETKTGE